MACQWNLKNYWHLVSFTFENDGYPKRSFTNFILSPDLEAESVVLIQKLVLLALYFIFMRSGERLRVSLQLKVIELD